MPHNDQAHRTQITFTTQPTAYGVPVQRLVILLLPSIVFTY